MPLPNKSIGQFPQATTSISTDKILLEQSGITKYILKSTLLGGGGNGTTDRIAKWTSPSIVGNGSWSFSSNDILPETTGSNIGSALKYIGTGFINQLTYTTNLIFSEAGTERARFLSSGQFILGATTGTGMLVVKGSGATSATYTAQLRNSADVVNFSVRDNGEINSRLGYWLGGNKFVHQGSVSSNTYLGHQAGTSDIDTTQTVGIGSQSFLTLTTGQGGVALGYAAARDFVGTRITALGINSCVTMTTPIGVTGVGDSTMNTFIAEGEYSTTLGFLTLNGITTGSRLIAIGARSCSTVAGQVDGGYVSSIAIGKDTLITASNQLVIGTESDGNHISDFAIGYGSTSTSGFTGNTTIRPTNVAVGQSNQANSYELRIAGGKGTGTGVGSNLIFQVATPGSSGSAQNALVEAWRISGANGYLSNTGSNGTAYIDLKAGSTSVAPIKLTSGTLTTSATVGTLEYNNNFYLTKTGTARFGLGGTLFVDYTDASNSGTGVTVLYTHSLLANTLDVNGSSIQIEAVIDLNDVNDVIRIDYGGQTVFTFDFSFYDAAGEVQIKTTILRTGASAERCYTSVVGPAGTTLVQPTVLYTEITTNTASNNNIELIVESAASGSNAVTAKYMIVKYLSPAA